MGLIEVPAVEIVEMLKEVPAPELQIVDKMVEKPVVECVERIVDSGPWLANSATHRGLYNCLRPSRHRAYYHQPSSQPSNQATKQPPKID